MTTIATRNQNGSIMRMMMNAAAAVDLQVCKARGSGCLLHIPELAKSIRECKSREVPCRAPIDVPPTSGLLTLQAALSAASTKLVQLQDAHGVLAEVALAKRAAAAASAATAGGGGPAGGTAGTAAAAGGGGS